MPAKAPSWWLLVRVNRDAQFVDQSRGEEPGIGKASQKEWICLSDAEEAGVVTAQRGGIGIGIPAEALAIGDAKREGVLIGDALVELPMKLSKLVGATA